MTPDDDDTPLSPALLCALEHLMHADDCGDVSALAQEQAK